tara:strand:- start:228 stop:497 length:270 start_codon:yes stop_codon:yes gene_type:complete
MNHHGALIDITANKPEMLKGLISLLDIIRLNVEFFFEDVEEIGTSDVSCCVNAVINDYAPLTEQYASTPTRQAIRRLVNYAISDFLDDD